MRRLTLVCCLMTLWTHALHADDKLTGTVVGKSGSGLDLGSPHVITRVGWMSSQRVQLGVFEGANSPDFMDALPLFLIEDTGTNGSMSYADVDCSRGFRYVRYVSPADAQGQVPELEFYGHQGEGDDSHLYQITNLPTVYIHTLNEKNPYDKAPRNPIASSSTRSSMCSMPRQRRRNGRLSIIMAIRP